MPSRPMPKNAIAIAVATRMALAVSRANMCPSKIAWKIAYTLAGLNAKTIHLPQRLARDRTGALASQKNSAQKRPDAAGDQQRLDGLGAHMDAQLLGIFVRPFL